MRFSEAVNLKKYPQGVTKIPNDEFEAAIQKWTKEMGARCGYRKRTRLEHWQEAIDTVYSALEAELGTTSTTTIQSDKKWEIMMLAAKQNFPEHIGLYHPSLIEQERVRRMVDNSKITRHIRNKAELLTFLKQDKDLGVKTISELAVSRLQCEVLAASAEILVSKYQGEAQSRSRFTASASRDANGSTETDLSKHGALASASADASAKAMGRYDTGSLALSENWKHRLSGAIGASATANGYADARARADDLEVSASAGLSGETQVSANVNYQIDYSCKVKVGYLRRLLGDKFKIIECYTGAKASAGLSGKANVAGSVLAGGSFTHMDEEPRTAHENKIKKSKRSDDQKDEQKERDKEMMTFLSADGGLNVDLCVRMEGNVGVTAFQSIDLQLTGDLFAGGAAGGNFKVLVNEQEVGMDIGAKVFAGFEGGFGQKVTLKHPGRGVTIFSAGFRETLSAGIGIQANATARASAHECYFDTSVGATVGVGTSIGATSVVSPDGIFLVAYDLMVAPAVLGIGHYMAKHHSGPHTQRMMQLCNYINTQASKAEINAVYQDNLARINACLAALDKDADKVQKMPARAPGFVSDAVDKQQVAKDVEGSSESKYYEYTTSSMKTKPLEVVFGSEASESGVKVRGHTIPAPGGAGSGMLGEKVKQEYVFNQTRTQGNKLSGILAADKQELHSVVKAYEQAKTAGSGECVAYEVLRQDMLEGKKISYS